MSGPAGRDSAQRTEKDEGKVEEDATAAIGNSILSAVKCNPRKRKRKTIDGVEIPLPGAGQRPAPRKLKPKSASAPAPRPVPVSDGKERSDTPWRKTDRLISDLSCVSTPLPSWRRSHPGLVLPCPQTPAIGSHSPKSLPVPRIAPLAVYQELTWSSPLPKPIPLEPPPTTSSLVSISPNLRSIRPRALSAAFFFSDPLVCHLRHPPAWKCDWSPSDQLVGEQDARAEAALTLSGLRRHGT